MNLRTHAFGRFATDLGRCAATAALLLAALPAGANNAIGATARSWPPVKRLHAN
jgi:hypothetical protein